MSVTDSRISANSQQGEPTHRDTRTTKHVAVKPLNAEAKEKTLRRKQGGEKQVYCSGNQHSPACQLLPLPRSLLRRRIVSYYHPSPLSSVQ